MATEVGSILFTVGMIVGGTIGYIAQIRVFNHFHSSDGFAPLVSIILLVANTLRVFYWLGAPFAYTLLFQALVMAFVQLVLVMTVLKIAQDNRVARLFPIRSSADLSSSGSNPIINLQKKVQEKMDFVLTLDAAASVDDIDSRVRKILPIGIHPSAAASGAGAASNSSTNRRSTTSASGSARTSPTTEMSSRHNDPSSSAFPDGSSGGGVSIHKDDSDSSSSTMSATEERIFSYLGSKGISTDSFLKLTPADFMLWYILGCFCVGMTVLGLSVIFGADIYQMVGYMALGLESTFLMPQVYLNYSRKSCEGLTAILLVTWVAGDVIKQIYFFVADQPTQFIMCGFVLLCCDATIVFQLFNYRHAHPRTDAARVGSVL